MRRGELRTKVGEEEYEERGSSGRAVDRRQEWGRYRDFCTQLAPWTSGKGGKVKLKRKKEKPREGVGWGKKLVSGLLELREMHRVKLLRRQIFTSKRRT